jgi:hypothetical protein
MKHKTLNFLLAGALSFSLISCDSKTQTEETAIEDNTLSDEEKTDGWELLFDGKTTDGWHLYNLGDVPSAWIVKGGELFCKPDTFEVVHGDLVSNKTYSNYDLTFDWNISLAGNSGVFINVMEAEENPTAWTSGPEYQLLDNLGIHKEYLDDTTHWAGCLYGYQKNLNVVEHKPAGEWNNSRILQENGVVKYWLNGVQTSEMDFNSEEWKELVANSSFKSFPNFGNKTEGHIALQDWSKGVSFRNIKIKNL